MRPREKLLVAGAQSLSDTELLAIFLRCGTKKRNVIELSTDLLQQCGGIRGLLQCQLADLKEFKGLGPAKWAQLQAIRELVHRACEEQLKQIVVMDSPALVREFLQTAIGHLSHEVFGVMLLDRIGQLIEFKILFRGTTDQTVVHPKEILKEAILNHAEALIICHNHPIGLTYPSQADLELTKKLYLLLNCVEIALLDHCIVSPNGFFSMNDAGLLETTFHEI